MNLHSKCFIENNLRNKVESECYLSFCSDKKLEEKN